MDAMVELKPDWEESKQRFLAFWQGEIVDRCCLAVKSPRAGIDAWPSDNVPTDAEGLRRYWLDPETNLARMLRSMNCTYYGGDAYPATTMCLGASAMAAFYGSPVEFREDTVWYHECIDDITAWTWDIDLEKAPLYGPTFEATRHYALKVKGKCLVGLPEIGSATDDLSLLRGMQNLVYDMVDEPEAVRRAIGVLTKTWMQVHSELYKIAEPCNDGGCPIPWMQVWAPGPCYQMSCDFSTALSPSLFREFIVPELVEYMTVNAYSVYHLDGPDELKHLDALLELDSLKAIQWTPGAGNEPTSHDRWMPFLKRIQSAGKRLILPCAEAWEVEKLLSELSSKGLLVSCWASNEQEARHLVSKATDWTHD